MAQVRENLLSDHQELRTVGNLYSEVLDMGENPQEFWANAGEWFAKVDDAMASAGGTTRVRLILYMSDSPDMAGKLRIYRYPIIYEATLITGYRFVEPAVYENEPTMRYLQVWYYTGTEEPFTTGEISAGFLTGHKDMKSKLTFDVNGPSDEGKLEYLLDDTVYDTWIYNMGRVIASERPLNVRVHYPQAVIGHLDKAKWMEFIRVNYAPTVWPRGQYSGEFEKDEMGVTLTTKVNGIPICCDTWKKDTNYVIYGARPAFNWTWADFIMWCKHHQDFMNAIETFDKQS